MPARTNVQIFLDSVERLSAKQVQLFVFPMFMAEMTPCYNEAVGNPEADLFKLECSDIDYKGVAPRNWEPL